MQQPPSPERGPHFWRGLAWGVIPLVIFLLTGALSRIPGLPSNLSLLIGLSLLGLIIGGAVYIFLLIRAIIHLRNPEQRFIGYGILAMLLITPVVAVYGCIFIGRGGFN
jgi:hypothetical protein